MTRVKQTPSWIVDGEEFLTSEEASKGLDAAGLAMLERFRSLYARGLEQISILRAESEAVLGRKDEDLEDYSKQDYSKQDYSGDLSQQANKLRNKLTGLLKSFLTWRKSTPIN